MKALIALLLLGLCGCECGKSAQAGDAIFVRKNFNFLASEFKYKDDGFWKYEDKNIVCYLYFYSAKIKFSECRWKIPVKISAGSVEAPVVINTKKKSKSWDEY